ncbi:MULTISPECIES: hypothetical protein [unclassified Virgibacillus]|uniref:hypothetical protein n=1 Tax=unclassified Virgibacillus TaxID=2620237 RepID=UPI00090B21D1|nr:MULTISPECIES: hypothetical protein [unclassified Virgibacillus]API92675.1 hypothetical protein BKP57_13195 [Virgibacillus sp. 6R]MBS7428168.1 hypothetical protein [Virgibacillus sp. 19R1-5]
MNFEKYFLNKDIEEAKDVFKQIERKMLYVGANLKDGDFNDAEQMVYGILDGIRILSDLSIEQQSTINLLKAFRQLKERGIEPMEIIQKYENRQN